jgi:EAL domain-containing protein (putative c-di-GMP-specific phosphodiesterase class I)
MEWISKLNEALEKNNFVLYFQPIVPFNASLKEPAKGEILIRMKEENGKIIPPISFLPAAENYKMMPEIDRWVILNTMKTVSESIAAGKDINSIPIISVNLSGASLDDDNLFLFINDAIQEYKVPARNFCFEITETVAMSNTAKATIFIDNLKRLGCTFALDDFGSGFSSFAYLKKFPADYLKIDGSLVKDIITEPVNIKMIQAINDLGHALGMKTIAEFVSAKDIHDMLAGIHVDYAQGYYISEPKPLSIFFPV